MALSLSNLVRKKSDKPPKIAFYGPGGVGKTTLASEFPDPIFIQTEAGEGALEITSFKDEPLASFAEVNEALVALASEDHAFKTLVVDSVTRLEPLIWDETCQRHKWASIEEPGYGKGYVEADAVWREFLSACTWLRDHKGMTIVLIGHEGVQSFADPTTDSYDRYQMRLHKRAEALIREDMDVFGFINQITTIAQEKKQFGKKDDYVAKARGSGQRAINLEPRPAFQAKNRYGMPGQILINPGQGYAALAPYLPGQPGNTAAAAA